jgi:hypothetical protein
MSLEPSTWNAGDEEAHSKLVSNLIKRTHDFTPETIANGASWYGKAQQDATHFGEVTGTGALGGGAAIGRLSGGTEFNLNRLQALQIPLLSSKQHKGLESIIKVQGEMSEEGKGKTTEEKQEVSKNIKDVTKPMRLKLGLGGTPLWHQTTSMAVDASRIAQGKIENPMSVFGNPSNSSNKTLDFAMGVGTGGTHPFIPIDTHAYDAAHDSYSIPYNTGNKHMTKVGVYAAVQSAYAQAHAHSLEKGLIPSHTTLADYQAMHWVHHIAHKRVLNKSSESSAKANETKVANILQRNPEFDPVKFKLPALSTAADLKPSINPRVVHFAAGSQEGR